MPRAAQWILQPPNVSSEPQRLLGDKSQITVGFQGAYVLQKPSPSLGATAPSSATLPLSCFVFLMVPSSIFALVYNMGREHEHKKVLAWLLTPPKQNLQWPKYYEKELSGDVRFMVHHPHQLLWNCKHFSYP